MKELGMEDGVLLLLDDVAEGLLNACGQAQKCKREDYGGAELWAIRTDEIGGRGHG